MHKSAKTNFLNAVRFGDMDAITAAVRADDSLLALYDEGLPVADLAARLGHEEMAEYLSAARDAQLVNENRAVIGLPPVTARRFNQVAPRVAAEAHVSGTAYNMSLTYSCSL